MEDTVSQSDQAGPYASNSDVVKNDETVDNESMDSEQIENGSDQIQVLFSTHSNATGKRPFAGPRANRNKG